MKFPLIKTEIDVSVEESERVRRKRNNRKAKTDEQLENQGGGTTETQHEKKPPGPKPVVMVKVENIQHEKFRMTEEVKVSESVLLSLLIKNC